MSMDMGNMAIEDQGAGKTASAARMYDYFLGGTHNFPADREAAQALMKLAPVVAASARANRAFLQRSVRFLLDQGIHQFLDIGSGIPTVGNVHEVAQAVPDARVMYVDIDPVAVEESRQLLDGNDGATAAYGDLRDPAAILEHPDVLRLLNFDRPVGLLLAAVLHFVGDAEAYAVVNQLLAALAPGSALVISHASVPDLIEQLPGATARDAEDIYEERTTTTLRLRDRAGVLAFFDGLDLVDPGLVWAPQWRPDPDVASEFGDTPADCAILVGVARLP